jgi:hypothetical protein
LREVDDRIRLWRNTVALFYELKTIGLKGPFKSAGYKIGIIEPVADPTGAGGVPDIVCSSGSKWAIIEVTLNDKPKKCQLDSYRDMNPRLFQQWLGDTITGKPNVICSRLENDVDDDGYCQIFVRDRFDSKNTEKLSDTELAEYLRKFNGTDISRSPDIQIQLIPEMASKSYELRRGLVNLVLKLAEPGCRGRTADQIVTSGLERIAENVSETSKGKLVKSVKQQLVQLVEGKMKDYMEYDDSSPNIVFRFKEGVNIENKNTRSKIVRLLKEWVGERKGQTELSDYDSNDGDMTATT